MGKGNPNIEELLGRAERLAGHAFAHREWLLEALTHRSYANEAGRGRLADNDRLEYLGDAVLDLLVGAYLYRHFPTLNSGDMSKLRAAVVNEGALANAARSGGLGELLLLGVGEWRQGGQEKPALLADAYEALLGALYLDGGLAVAEGLVARDIYPLLEREKNLIGGEDHKSVLQEWCAKRHLPLPTYAVVEREGPDHDTHYTVEVLLDGQPQGRGRGRSVKLAEQAAAAEALRTLASPQPEGT